MKNEKPPEQQETDLFLQERANMVGVARNKRESMTAFRRRVVGTLRTRGHLIEAYEALSGKLYDDPEQGPMGPMAGILGAVAQRMQGISYSSDPEQKMGDDLAAGVLVSRGEDSSKSALAAIFSLLGPKTGMDVIDGLTKPKTERPQTNRPQRKRK